MATLGITIKSDFDQASKDLKEFKATSVSTAASMEKFQKSFKSEKVDQFLDKQKLTKTAITATRGEVQASQIEYRNLQKEIERLIKRGLNPNDESLKKLTKRYDVLQSELNQTEKETKQLTNAQKNSATQSKLSANAAALGAKALLSVKLAAIAAGAAIIKNTFTIAKAGDEYSKASRRIGLSAEALQELEFAADRQGVSGEELTKGLEKLNKNVGDLRAGYGSLNTVLKNTNPELLQNLKNAKSNEEAWELSVNALNNASDELERASLAQALFGRSGLKLLTVTEAGTEGIKALRQEARKYGIISNENAVRAEEFIDAQTNLQAAFKGIRNEIGVRLFPALQKLLELATAAFLKLNKAFEPIDEVIDKLSELNKKFNISGKVFAVYATAAKLSFNIFKISFGQAARVTLNGIALVGGSFIDLAKTIKAALTGEGLGAFKEFGQKIKDRAIQFVDDFTTPYKQIATDFKSLMKVLTDSERIQVEESKELGKQKTANAIEEAKKRTAAELELEKLLKSATFEVAQMASDTIFELMQQNRDREFAAANQYTQQLAALDEADKQRTKDKIQEEYEAALKAGDKELADEKKRSLERIDLEEKQDKRAKELAKEAFEVNKNFATAQAIVNTALAVTQALANLPPPASYITAGISAVAGALEVATIRNQSFTAQTGTSPDGLIAQSNKRSGQDNVNFSVADGETVSVTPRGENVAKKLIINNYLNSEILYSVVQDGIDSGEINILAENIQGMPA